MSLHLFTLQNGIRVVFQKTNSPVGHCALVVNTGSRDELEHEHGMAHFIEHCLFKGTQKRKSYQILNRLDGVGGEINAFTTKEETAVHASFPAEYLDRAVDLITDLVLHPVFPEKEIEKEKEVITDEILGCMDDPAEQITDDFEDLLFQGHALGRSILGTEKSVKSFTRQRLIEFYNRSYLSEDMVFSCSGNYSIKYIQNVLNKHLKDFSSLTVDGSSRQPFQFKGSHKKLVNRTGYQAHVMLGSLCYDINDDRRISAAFLNNLLAGPPMNTRLGMELREKKGIAYTIESSYNPYSDTGWFGVYFGTTENNINRAIDLIYREYNKILKNGISARELSMLQKQLTGYLIMSSENHAALVINHAKNVMYYGETFDLEQILNKIKSVNTESLLSAAHDFLQPDQQSVLIFNPAEA